jgi:hypothetical protein
MYLLKGFDLYGFDRSSKEDEKGILETSKYRKDNYLLKNYFLLYFL